MPRTITVEISDHTAAQLEDLLRHSFGPAKPDTLEELTCTLLEHWADGWRRPGSWERGMLEQMGHV